MISPESINNELQSFNEATFDTSPLSFEQIVLAQMTNAKPNGNFDIFLSSIRELCPDMDLSTHSLKKELSNINIALHEKSERHEHQIQMLDNYVNQLTARDMMIQMMIYKMLTPDIEESEFL
nr:hypothetical protein [Erwinia sp. Ejp617]